MTSCLSFSIFAMKLPISWQVSLTFFLFSLISLLSAVTHFSSSRCFFVNVPWEIFLLSSYFFSAFFWVSLFFATATSIWSRKSSIIAPSLKRRSLNLSAW